jgi:glucuronate isomerase
MHPPLNLHEDRLFPSDPAQRGIARRLYAEVRALPILSPHGHTDPQWFAENQPFPDPSTLLIIPDHYVYRMLYSQGVPLEALGVARKDGKPVKQIRAGSGACLPTTGTSSAARLRRCGSAMYSTRYSAFARL